ncbi:MAG: GNAT family N-acetyltransferase [Methyloceanibacter sp.]|nr:GNAT family N-acetyltransferase [Methyloceanibacter sp.]
MSAEANPQLALRPMLPGEAPLLEEIFVASIMELTQDDYEIEQQEAWIAKTNADGPLAKMLADHTTIVATMSGSPVGFGSLESDDKIGLLYVHPAAVERGAGTLLADALEKIAAGRGAEDLSVDASDSAYDFFNKRGYAAQQRNSVRCGDEWLSNTTMKKTLSGPETVQ